MFMNKDIFDFDLTSKLICKSWFDILPKNILLDNVRNDFLTIFNELS